MCANTAVICKNLKIFVRLMEKFLSEVPGQFAKIN